MMSNDNHNRLRLLVVEDEAALATMLRYNLEKQGFRVEEAGDGEEALTRISEAQPDLVLLDWENEAHLALKETPGAYEIVYPSRSIQAEPPVALVDKNVDRHKTRAAAEAFLKFL